MADLPSEAGSCLIIGAEADGVGPSVLLTCAGSQRQYLFGAAEGFSRLALECRARPTAKLRAVFLSSFRPRASGGLGGLLLRLCADGHKSVCLAGPPGVGTHVQALRDFVRFRHPEVTALRLVPPGLRSQDVFAPDDTRACDAAAESYRDDAVMVFPLFAPLVGAESAETCQLCAAVAEARAAETRADSSSEASTSSATERSSDASDASDADDVSRANERHRTNATTAKTASARVAPPFKQRRTSDGRDGRATRDERARRRVLGYACAVRDGDVDARSGDALVSFLILDCADDADARAAAANATVRCCLRNAGSPGSPDARPRHPAACAVFHLTPRDVASRPAYDEARRRAGGASSRASAPSFCGDGGATSRPTRTRATLHVDCSVAGEVGFRVGARTLAKLHAVDPETFPLSPTLRAPYRAPEPGPTGADDSDVSGRAGIRSAVGSLCATVTLFRAASAGSTPHAAMDQRSRRAPELDVDAVVAATRARAAAAETANAETARAETANAETKAWAARAGSCARAPSLLFLGTGSAEPSASRGSSGVLVKLPPPERGGGALGAYAMLDCGEGAAGATRRFLGEDEGGRVLDELRFVFVTHHHPDHMAGLLGVLAARSRRAPPLRVLGPSAAARWLRHAVEVGAVGDDDPNTKRAEMDDETSSSWWARSPRAVDDGVARLVAFTRVASLYALDGGSFGGPFWIPPKHPPSPASPPFGSGTGTGTGIPPPPPPPPPHPPHPPHSLRASLGLSRLEAVPVEHCPEASAVILACPGGFSLCYSGDCRPSRRLAAAARGVHVLVHEATFADDLRAHAERKRHSTVSEALRVSDNARAGATILTHFSQRYPKAVAVASATPRGRLGPVACAFDGMVVRFDALGRLAETARGVDAMFEAAEAEAAAAEETEAGA